MSELKMISPLLDHMTVEGESNGQNDQTRYTLRSTLTGECFTLQCLSFPASDRQIRALILSGAYPDEAAVHAYYTGVINDLKAELDTGKALAASGNGFAGCVSYQIEPKETGVGYDVYILRPPYVPLNEVMQQTAMTNLRAVNLGLDLCDALSACREAGYLFGNLRPESVYFTPAGKFLLGDLGLVSLGDLEYACLPEDYIGPFSAPELSDITATPNQTVDLYSLGMLLYRVYNGGHGPFEDEHTGEAMADKLRLTGKPLPTPIYADYELAGIILKACSFRKEERYQTPEELKQALTLYMQRNEVSDTLIVPPIVAAPEPIAELPEEAPEEEPMRMTDAEQLDEDFRRSFSPDLTGTGSEEDIDPTIPTPAAKAEQPKQPEQLKQEPAQLEEVPNPVEVETPTEDFLPDSTADVDPDQIDIDELLASVSAFVGEDDAPSAEETETDEESAEHDYVDETAEGETEEAPAEQSKKHSGKIAKVMLILLLVVLLAAAVYIFLAWYYVDAETLELRSCTPDSISVELISEDSAERFTISCTDSYGNAYPAEVQEYTYTFTGLNAKTSYTVSVAAAAHHKLRGEYKLDVLTPETTEIVDFSAMRGDAEGEVLISFAQEGPSPARWKLTYAETGQSEKNTVEFAGNAYRIDGLQENKKYTFCLENTDSIYLTGQVSIEYELLPIVEARDLNIAEIRGSALTVVWTPGENLPETWTVTCEAEGLDPITETPSEPSCMLALPDLAHDYTISVSAPGMDIPATLQLPANPIVVENLQATASENGALVSWDTPAGSPIGGWYVSYNPVGSYHEAYLPDAENSAVNGNSVELTGLIPNTEYEITLSLTAKDASATTFGVLQTRVTTAEAAPFDDYEVSPTPPIGASSGQISLWTLPAQEDWDYTNLRNNKTTFAPDEKIAVCIEISSVASSEDPVTLLYAIRDAEGHVVNDVATELPWDNVWYSRRHANAIPLPAARGAESTPGDYRLEIYINGKLLSSIGFTIA